MLQRIISRREREFLRSIHLLTHAEIVTYGLDVPGRGDRTIDGTEVCSGPQSSVGIEEESLPNVEWHPPQDGVAIPKLRTIR